MYYYHSQKLTVRDTTLEMDGVKQVMSVLTPSGSTGVAWEDKKELLLWVGVRCLVLNNLFNAIRTRVERSEGTATPTGTTVENRLISLRNGKRTGDDT